MTIENKHAILDHQGFALEIGLAQIIDLKAEDQPVSCAWREYMRLKRNLVDGQIGNDARGDHARWKRNGPVLIRFYEQRAFRTFQRHDQRERKALEHLGLG